MDDAGRVGPGQGVRHRDRDPQHLAEGHALARDSGSRVFPTTYSMTMKSMPSTEPISWMVTMFGWFRAEAARASRTNRARRSLVRDALPAAP